VEGGASSWDWVFRRACGACGGAGEGGALGGGRGGGWGE
jgi:hypothetical protein